MEDVAIPDAAFVFSGDHVDLGVPLCVKRRQGLHLRDGCRRQKGKGRSPMLRCRHFFQKVKALTRSLVRMIKGTKMAIPQPNFNFRIQLTR